MITSVGTVDNEPIMNGGMMGPNMQLTDHQRMLLRDAAAAGIASIDEIITQLRRTNPEAFHTSESLVQRVFIHDPGHAIPFARAITGKAVGPLRRNRR